jgi:O-antigen ligase
VTLGQCLLGEAPTPPRRRDLTAGRITGWWLVAGGTTLAALGAVHGTSVIRPAAWAVLILATYRGSRELASRHHLLVPGLVLTVTAVVTASGLAEGDLLDPLRGPLGYANATGAFFVTSAGAALLARTHVAGRVPRALLLGLALALLTVPIGANSRTATLLGLFVLATALPARFRPHPRPIALAGTAGVLAVSAVVLTVVRRGDVISRALGIDTAGLSPSVTERVRLWGEAIRLVGDAPLTGVGPGMFGPAGTPARMPWEQYAHNEYLQVAAELGLPALLVVLAGLALTYRRLSTAPDRDAALVGVVVLTALCLHACVDYVVHVPAVVLAAAATVGAAAPTVGRRSTDLRSTTASAVAAPASHGHDRSPR